MIINRLHISRYLFLVKIGILPSGIVLICVNVFNRSLYRVNIGHKVTANKNLIL